LKHCRNKEGGKLQNGLSLTIIYGIIKEELECLFFLYPKACVPRTHVLRSVSMGVTQLAQGHTVSKQQSWAMNSKSLTSESRLLTTKDL
jgi:hypothetical protein